MSKYNYRFLKSSWGIAIDIVGSHAVLKTKPMVGQKVSSKIWLNFQMKNFVINDKEKSWINEGLELVSEQICSRSDDSKYILITIHEIYFNPCDYQIEGLALAIMGWAGQEFGFAPPKSDIVFDRETNQYNVSLAKI